MPVPPPPSSSGGGSSTRPADVGGAAGGGGGGGGKGGGGILLPLLALGGVGVGAAYYADVIPAEYLPDALNKKVASPPPVASPPKKREEVVAREKLREVVEEVIVTKREPSAVVVVVPAESESAAAGVVPDRPAEATKASDSIPMEVEVAEEVDGSSKGEHAPPRDAPAEAAAAESEEKEIRAADPPTPDTPTPPPAMVADAMSELRSSSLGGPSRTLAAANVALLSESDGSEYLYGVDELAAPQLRIRVVQLASEMKNRTKWEASRLREFLAMKEKETEGRYMEILQNQRLEYENLLAQRLREQEDVITRHANAALAAKEEGIQDLMKATSDARDKEMEDALTRETRIVAEGLELDYEQRLQNELAAMKQAHAVELNGYVSVMTTLRDKLDALERRLEVSRDFESGSRRAHRVSAAALALAGKLEAGGAAAVELAALRGAAGDGMGVIASAVTMIPRSANGGVPTLAELQATFDECYRIGREVSGNRVWFREDRHIFPYDSSIRISYIRESAPRSCDLSTYPQAAMVPEGRAGLNGQLLGMLFAKLSVPPSPDAVPKSEEEGSVADGVLSLARKYVHLGDLEKAVEQLDRLGGQTAYVMSDWKTKAADRVSTERALKVIKLECALLNKDMVGSES